MTIPLSTMSIASSGGVFLEGREHGLDDGVDRLGEGLARISSLLTTTVLGGTPATMSRPFTSLVSCFSTG